MDAPSEIITSQEPEVFYCEQNGASGKGVLLGAKCFRVLQGATGRSEVADSCPENIKKLRVALAKRGIITLCDGILTMNVDWDFDSPSAAAALLTGYNRSGLKVWKNRQGKTLGDVLKERHPGGASHRTPEMFVKDLLICNQNGAKGTGYLLPNGHFRLHRASLCRKAVAKSCPASIVRLREQLISNGELQLRGEHLVLQSDYVCDSCHAAAQFLTGYSRNGLDVWKNEEDITLKQLKADLALP